MSHLLRRDRRRVGVAHIFAQVPLAKAAHAFALSKAGDVAGKVAVVVDNEMS